MTKQLTIFLLFILNTIYAYVVDLKNTKLYNETAYITSQCYTKTVDEDDKTIKYNPCYSCHTKNKEPNYTLYDDDLQEVYDFPSPAFKNHWTNLFKDRTQDIKNISDKEILKYVKQNNYKKNAEIILEKKLSNIPKNWDFNNNGKWDGYIPDCNFEFDNEGFDKDNNGKFTGWRAFAYYPFLGTFWPTNGSTDDVLIRLDKVFQQDKNGNFDKEIYKLNLSIVESLIKQKTIKIDPVDETLYEVDLNQNGKLDLAKQIVFKWEKPKYNNKTLKLENFTMSYVGYAKKLLNLNEYLIAPGLYPKNTEFLHSVRYLDIDKNNNIKISPRMKELRYAKKRFWYTYFQLSNGAMEIVKEKEASPDNTEKYIGNIEVGLNNKQGWYYQGFIEDKKGDLRPQSFEENVYCMGCHSNIGATTDSTFVFARKFEKNSFANGWYHWSKKDFKNIPDNILKNGEGEYSRYLKVNNSGDEFRQNNEIKNKFFNKDHSLKQKKLEILKKDISYLLIPSKKRALELNKAYKVIVNEQSYIYGRDTHIKPANNVYKQIKDAQITHLKKINN
jgi:hypothetical protein